MHTLLRPRKPNAKARAKALLMKLTPLLKAGKFAAVQACELWSTEERVHLRPGHFWACELGNADGEGSPIMHTFTKKSEVFEASDGQKYRGDAGDCVLAPYQALLPSHSRGSYNATSLTFMRWQAKKGEVLLVNSTELRAVAGHQANDFVLTPLFHPHPQSCKSATAVP